ncbi:MAG: stage V sporulation protein D, partial [Clostridia bacterium]|nr:stage V sporulation protein D [Clostridia bacterium]
MDKISHFSIKKRIFAGLLLIVVVFFALFARLFYIQILWGTTLQYKAYDQWTRDLPFRADRGDITDINGVVLANSTTSYTLYARPNELKDVDYIA